MKFCEALLRVVVESEFAEVYKKGIEGENERYFTENPVYDKEGRLISNDIKPVWSGNYVNAEIVRGDTKDTWKQLLYIEITVLSRTQTNVEQFIKQYEREGATLVKKNF